MNVKTRVVVCGTSLYMASLAAGLRSNPAFDVVQARTDSAELDACLRDRTTTVVAFDLAEIPVDLPVTLLREWPGLLLLGLDPTSDELLVLSGHPEQAVNLADLVKIIARQRSAEPDIDPQPGDAP